jgi:hypothetical protein
VQTPGVYDGPTRTLMGLIKVETQLQADCHSDCLVIQAEIAYKDGQGVGPVTAVWGIDG